LEIRRLHSFISRFTLVTIAYKVAMLAPAERADTLPLFHLYHYMYSMVVTPLTIFPSTIV
jgi:hypothetical protein